MLLRTSVLWKLIAASLYVVSVLCLELGRIGLYKLQCTSLYNVQCTSLYNVQCTSLTTKEFPEVPFWPMQLSPDS